MTSAASCSGSCRSTPARSIRATSKSGRAATANYLSLTCTFAAQSREQLDALYQELTSCERVLVVL